MRAVPFTAMRNFLKEHEDCVLRVYDDARPKKVLKKGDQVLGRLTAGYGHTGPELEIEMEVTQALANQWLLSDLEKAAVEIYSVVDSGVMDALTTHQWMALLSFVFNVGCDRSWTIWKRLNARQFDQVPLELMKFVNAKLNGKKVKVQGLVNRRAAEVTLWSINEPGSVPTIPSSSVTRAVDTPPTPGDPVAPSKSATVLTAAVGALGAVPVAAEQIRQAVAPWQDASHVAAQIVAVVATVAAIAAVAALVLTWAHKRTIRG